MTSCPPADLWSICSLYFWWFSWRKTKPSIIWPYHSFISYAILQLILRPALHLLIYFKILVFLVVTVAHSYPFIKYSVKRWTKPSITFTMMTSNFEANYSSDTEANSKSGFETVVIANCILNAPLMLLSIIGNALVLVAILKTPSIRSPSVIFLCSLAVSDLLVGLVAQPVYIAAEIARTVRYFQAADTVGFAGCGVSLATMTAITVDRFLALHYHLQYPNLMTTSRAIYTIITIWCISTLFTFSFIWSPSIYHYFVSAFGITIFLLVNLVCFIEIHRIVRRHQLQIQLQQQAVENSIDTNNHHIRQSTKSAKSIFIYCFFRGHGNESCNLIGSLPGQYFPISAHGPR